MAATDKRCLRMDAGSAIEDEEAIEIKDKAMHGNKREDFEGPTTPIRSPGVSLKNG